MVSAHLVDAIRDPSHAIIDLYDGGGSAELDFPVRVTSHFATVFRTQDSIQQASVRYMRLPQGTYASDLIKDPTALSRLPSGCSS